MASKRTSDLPLICLVCGDIARGYNFDVMSCMSCKVFFRRHALKTDSKLYCQHANRCEITRTTRSSCSACRLKKCFALGMNKNLIRRWCYPRAQSKYHSSIQQNNSYGAVLPKPLPLNLLRRDRSTLADEEWTLLSNIIHAYDEANGFMQISDRLGSQSMLPPKLRSKSSISLSIFRDLLSIFLPFIKRTPYFHNLSVNAQHMLIENNYEMVGTFNAIFVIREMHALENALFTASCATNYGYEVVNYANNLIRKLEPNSVLVKVMILIMAFSNNCSIVSFNGNGIRVSLSNTLCLFNLQNIFVTMFWKYLNYRYGFQGAVLYFSRLTTFMVNILFDANLLRNSQHYVMVDGLIEELKHSLEF